MKVGIELHKADTILKQLRGRRKKWTGRPGGITVRIWARATEHGVRVCWQCFPKKAVAVNGSASTVTDAIKQCNAVLVPSETPQAAEVVVMTAPTYPKGLPAPLARQEWLPYKDAEL